MERADSRILAGYDETWGRWFATWDGYDGAPDAPNRKHIGYGPTEADAIRDLCENITWHPDYAPPQTAQ